jgi:hypothetical protein
MATYKSEVVSLAYPAETVFGKLSNLEGLGGILKNVPADKVPADQLAMLEQVRVTPDTISFPAGPAGEVTLKVAETDAPNLIRMEGFGTPVPMSLTLHITPLTPETCEIDIQIPAMLKPMVNGPLQKMADQFAQMLRQVPMA